MFAISLLKLSLISYEIDTIDMQMKFDNVIVYQIRFR